MKKGLVILLLLGTVCARSQSLKEALFSGKLKNTPGTVIRKGDDLTAKIDTAQKVAVQDSAKTSVALQPVDSAANKPAEATQSNAVAAAPATTPTNDATPAATATDTAQAAPAAAPPTAAAIAKDNNALLKSFMDSVVSSLKTEALPSKKLKSGSYYVLVSYAIGTDGQISVSDVFVSPENEFLQQQVKDRLAVDAPRLTPVLSSSGTPRKVNKKYNFTLVKP